MRVDLLLRGPVLTAFVMLMIFLSMLLLALGFPPKARLMPLLVSLPATLLAVVQLVAELRAAAQENASDGRAAAERNMFAWIILFFAGILLFGFNLAAPLLVFAFLKFGRGETLPVALVSAAATWGVLWGFFEGGFEIPLFPGLLVEWLFG